MQSIITFLVDRPGRWIGSLVEVREVRAKREPWEVRTLIALLVIAAIVRFWGVGSFSLHKPDEDTSALPAAHILLDGVPRFPSGMFYGRAIAQSYLVAGSAKIFGQTEWALRLPSVLAGIVLVFLAYLLGRRFLEPPWNMTFVAVVALLPGMIADSQELRMYIFLSSSLAAYMILLFRWERTGHTSALLASFVAMIVAIQFQEIAVFSSILYLFPGLAHGDSRKLRQGLLFLIMVAGVYLVISHWVGSFYPKTATDYLPPVSQTGEAPHPGALRFHLLILLPAIIFSVALVWLNIRTISKRAVAVVAGVLIWLGLVLQAVLYWHLGILMIVAGVIVARRHGGARRFAVALLVGEGVAVAAAQVILLHGAHVGSIRKIVGVMVGQPSIWPYLQVAAYSPVAMLLVVVALGIALWGLAMGRKISDDVLFAMLGVFVPLFGIGFFGWYIPPRYGEFALLPLLLCAVVAARHAVASRWDMARLSTLSIGCLAAIACIAIVNPIAVARSINAGGGFPDHRGEARFMRSLKLQPGDIVVAEEILMQTYYLGHVDYWLTGPRNAADYVIRVNGRLVDEYTSTPIIDSMTKMQALIDQPSRGAIYIIGSGENQQDGREATRGQEINKFLRDSALQVVYQAHDGVTKIWKIPPSSADHAPVD
jgi:4-amino-4-deoxy-L-arabinose transferase-like glycosyltransferase